MRETSLGLSPGNTICVPTLASDLLGLMLSGTMPALWRVSLYGRLGRQMEGPPKGLYDVSGQPTNPGSVETVDNFNAIESFYGLVHKKKEGYLWNALMEIENKIVTGEVTSFSGVMHLPLHWVSVVVDF